MSVKRITFERVVLLLANYNIWRNIFRYSSRYSSSLLKCKIFNVFYVEGCQGTDLQSLQPDVREKSTGLGPVCQVTHQFSFLAFTASTTLYCLVTEEAVGKQVCLILFPISLTGVDPRTFRTRIQC